MITGTDAFVIAAGAGMGLTGAANDRAAQAAWDNRVNAYLAQGMTYAQACACARDTYRQEAQRLGPRGPAAMTVIFLFLAMLFFIVCSFPILNAWSYVFWVIAGGCFLGLRHQWRLYQARYAWAHPQPTTRVVTVSEPRTMIGSA
jgi:hypothetical protein